MADTEMLVDVDIPIDIEGAFDPDGLPKVVAKPVLKADPPTPTAAELETLRRERDAERAARTKAEQDAMTAVEAARAASGRAQQTEVQAYGAHFARVNAELQQISSAIAAREDLVSAAERELIAAERDMAGATEPHEREAIAERKVKAQRELSEVASELTALRTGKRSAEDAVKEAKYYYEATVDAAARQPAPQDKKPEPAQKQLSPDEWIDTCPPATRPWLREHKEWRKDDKMLRKILRFADEYSDDHGGTSALDSQDFVAALNDKFYPQKGNDDVEDDTKASAEPAQRARSVPAAPVSRGSAPGAPSGSRSSQVRLSADEQATALAMYPEMARPDALKKYATNKARAIADGLYAPR